MDFCNALLNKLPFPQAVEKQMAQFTVYRLESPGIISVSLYCCLEVTTERVLRVGGGGGFRKCFHLITQKNYLSFCQSVSQLKETHISNVVKPDVLLLVF